LLLPPFSSALSATLPLCCVLVFSSLFIVQFFVVVVVVERVWRVSLPKGLCWFIPGVARGIPSAHLFGMPNVSQAGLELVSGGGGNPPVFSV
jgi:hypothetical protein